MIFIIVYAELMRLISFEDSCEIFSTIICIDNVNEDGR